MELSHQAREIYRFRFERVRFPLFGSAFLLESVPLADAGADVGVAVASPLRPAGPGDADVMAFCSQPLSSQPVYDGFKLGLWRNESGFWAKMRVGGRFESNFGRCLAGSKSRSSVPHDDTIQTAIGAARTAYLYGLPLTRKNIAGSKLLKGIGRICALCGYERRRCGLRGKSTSISTAQDSPER